MLGVQQTGTPIPICDATQNELPPTGEPDPDWLKEGDRDDRNPLDRARLERRVAADACSAATVDELWDDRRRMDGTEQELDHRVAYRMFTAPDFGRVCSSAPAPTRLVAESPVIFRLGEWFPLASLKIVAVDASNLPLRPVPLSIEVQNSDPPLLNLQSNMIADLPIRPSRFLFRARTICPGTAADVFFPATVRAR